MSSLVKLINKCTRAIDCRLAGVFSKNQEHLSHPVLVLILELRTGKCWLGKASLTFCQINRVMSIYIYKKD